MPVPRSLLYNIDQRIAEVQRLKQLLAAKRHAAKLQDPIVWVEYYRTLKGEPFSFQDREYLLPIYRDRHRNVAVVKARQMEMTEFALNWTLFNLTTYPYTNGLYTFPRFDQVSRFSKDRVKVAIMESPRLQPLIQDEGDVMRLPLTDGSRLYMLSAWGDFGAVRNIPVDFAVIDEAQDVPQKDLAVLKESMEHSRYKRLLMLGTGSDEAGDWQKIWLASDMKEWSKEAKAWVPAKPENVLYSGYHVDQYMASWLTREEIDAKRFDPAYTERRFVTEVLGQFYRGLRKPITPADIESCLDRTLGFQSAGTGRGPVFIGVDWGGGITGFSVVWILEKIEDRWITLYVHKFTERDLMKQAEIVANLILQYDASRCVADLGYGVTQVGYLQAKFADRVLGCQYTQRPEMPLEVDWERMTIRADRSFNLERTIDLVTAGRERFAIPYANPSAIEWCFDHLTAIEAQESQTVAGRNYRRYVHPEGQPDDALHSLNYALIAGFIGDIDYRMYPA